MACLFYLPLSTANAATADQVYHLVIPFSKGLIAVYSQVSELPKKNSHFPSLTVFSSSSYSSPSPIAAAENPSTWSRVTETKGETTIEHLSDFIAALASRRKG